MRDTVIENLWLERGSAFSNLTLRSRDGGLVTVEEVEGEVRDGRRSGRVRTCWSGRDEAAGRTAMEQFAGVLRDDGYALRA
jgi:hypothetical protein